MANSKKKEKEEEENAIYQQVKIKEATFGQQL
jgi:hypothetical protein